MCSSRKSGALIITETRTVDVHIRYLRQKIENDDSKPEYIETVRGIDTGLYKRPKPVISMDWGNLIC